MKYLIEPVAAGGGDRRQQEHDTALHLLAQLTGGEAAVEHDSLGAPYLPSRPDLHISISHCRTAVAVAVSDRGPVGIDIESRRRIGDGLVQRVCSPAEASAVAEASDPTMYFLQLWTRKEAVLKCRGTGIRGFGSMVHALEDTGIAVRDLPCRIPNTVASVAERI